MRKLISYEEIDANTERFKAQLDNFIHFDGDHARMSAAGVKFLEAPRREVYATVAVFEDLYGNRWDLLQPK